jgi:hypothetical protein
MEKKIKGDEGGTIYDRGNVGGRGCKKALPTVVPTHRSIRAVLQLTTPATFGDPKEKKKKKNTQAKKNKIK